MDVKGIKLKTYKHNTQLAVVFEPLLLDSPIDAKTLNQLVLRSEYDDFFLLDNAIYEVCDVLNSKMIDNNAEAIEYIIGQAKDAVVEVTVTADKMYAELIVTAPYHGHTPNLQEMLSILHANGVKRGIGKKRIREFILDIEDSKPGIVCTQIVAKGLPPKQGKNSYLKPTVPNALERVLAPKESGDEKVDMRDFGELICVSPNQEVARRVAPSKGRRGFTVTGDVIDSEPGKWKPIKMGDNVYIPDTHKNTVLAKVAGLPKFANQKISVDDVLVTKGVNVATGNVKYAGAVIVNGDVTEKMRIMSDGDITINGFVESAYIESGGDIIITQGATGKMNDVDCQLIARGSLFLEHGQGLHINTTGNVTVAKQLAYSNVSCKGDLTIGTGSKPMGKIFASTIEAYSRITAGYVGAVSGSELIIDYTLGFETLQTKFDSMLALFKDLSSKNADHEIKVSNINNRSKSNKNESKLAELNKELELERVFLNWLRINMEDLKQQTINYETEMRVKANHTLFPGVNMKFRKSNWKVDKEYSRGKIIRDEDKWVYHLSAK